jgi:hypothetical protein
MKRLIPGRPGLWVSPEGWPGWSTSSKERPEIFMSPWTTERNSAWWSPKKELSRFQAWKAVFRCRDDVVQLVGDRPVDPVEDRDVVVAPASILLQRWRVDVDVALRVVLGEHGVEQLLPHGVITPGKAQLEVDVLADVVVVDGLRRRGR